jgi:phosphoglycerate dehydrogenase-like enzyme
MNILFCGKNFPETEQHLTRFLPDDRLFFCQADELPQQLVEADVVVPLGTTFGKELMTMGNFGLIQQFGVGLETVDIEAATRNGIWVARIPSAESGNAASVAEHALLLMLMLSRKMAEARQSLQEGRVGSPIGQALAGKTACIIGLGGLGRALARRLSTFEMRVVAVNDYPDSDLQGIHLERVFSLAELREALPDADYVVLCINYTPDRYHLFGEAELAVIKPGAFLINVARGGLLDQDALLKALESKHVAGAGLDVFWSEPVDPRHPLFAQNVIATPHIAGVTDLSYTGIAAAFADNVRRYARGETPFYLANSPASPRRLIR